MSARAICHSCKMSGNDVFGFRACRGRILTTFMFSFAQVPGFVAFIGAGDIPKGGSDTVFGDALFATEFADYAGQRIGLAVATSQVGKIGKLLLATKNYRRLNKATRCLPQTLRPCRAADRLMVEAVQAACTQTL